MYDVRKRVAEKKNETCPNPLARNTQTSQAGGFAENIPENLGGITDAGVGGSLLRKAYEGHSSRILRMDWRSVNRLWTPNLARGAPHFRLEIAYGRGRRPRG